MSLKNEEKDKKSRLILFFVILALLVVNGALIINLLNKKGDIEEITEENVDLTEDVNRLDKELNALDLELVNQKGKNQQLDSIINIKEKIIADQVSQLRQQLKRKDLTKAQISKLEGKIRSLNGLVMKYEHEVDSLSKLNDFLEDEVYARDQEIAKHKQEKDEIAQDLSKANIQLDIAKRLETQSIIGTGIKTRSNGDKEVTKLSKSDLIRISITLDKNPVADKESKTCYLQIVGPEKSTLHNAQKGSGTFVFNGEKSLYTLKKIFTFNNSNETLTFDWDKSPAMTSGDYTANAYCEGVKIGTTTFNLK
ncbi:MAG: outer membrane murein-binding lipoprotein Lpp [Bacteroidia bacterium]|jgi:outer membrane murein-binding lipoprotein Lpp